MITPEVLLRPPVTDPTSIYRYRDGIYAVDLLTAAMCHLDFFGWLSSHPADLATICRSLGLKERPVDVMLTLFTAQGLVQREGEVFALTPLGKEHLAPSSPYCIAPYFGSMKDRPVCRDIAEVLRTGKPSNWASLRSEKEWAKALENPTFASQFTAAMDCRGVYLAQAMAKGLECGRNHHLLDIAGGSGIYACAMVARHPHLRATVLEKSPVDKLTRQMITQRGFSERVSVATADMFHDPLPEGADMHLFSNVLHDWDVPQVEQLLAKSFAALKPRGMIVIHDAHINSDKTGPLAVAEYSVLLMTISEGKCYSEKEMSDFLHKAGFSSVRYFPTVVDRSVITAKKE